MMPMIAEAAGAALAAVLAATFAAVVLQRRRAPDLLWGAGLVLYALAAGLEALASAAGWSPAGYVAYLVSAGLTVGLLGLGTVALVASPSATRVGVGLVVLLGFVLALGLVDTQLAVAGAPWDVGADLVPFPHPSRVAFLLLNALGGLALVGGALATGWRARRPGVLLIGAGALLPFLGGTLGALDVAAVRVAFQLAGVALMFAGYLYGRAAGPARAAVPEAA